MKLFLIAFTASGVGMAALVTDVRCIATNSTQSDAHSASGTSSASTACLVSGNVAAADVSARASYGSLSNSVSPRIGPITDPFSQPRADGYATSSYTDTLTILGTGAGSIRAMLFYSLYTIDGDGFANFTLASYKAPTTSPSFPHNEVATVPIEFGVPFSISAQLQTHGVADFLRGGSERMSFLQSFQVLDATGTKLTSFQYVSSSNAAYLFEGGTRIEIPEPASLALVFSGIASCGLVGLLLHGRAATSCARSIVF